MSVIGASTDNNPANPISYATSMANVVDGMTQNTLAAVGNMIGGLPTVSSMAAGAYGFEGGVINASNSAYAASSQQLQDFMSQNVNQILPVISNLASAASANQAAAIQAQQTAASHAGGGGKK